MERKMVAAMGVLLVVLLQGAEAQSTGGCISSLTICYPFLGSKNPSAACCDALQTTVKNDLVCLCNLLGKKDLIKQVDLSQALELPKLCGITTDASICGSVKTGAAPLASPPPATPGGNSGHALSLSVVPVLTALLLFFLTVAMA